MKTEQEHWERVYATKDAAAVSWYEETPETSLRMIAATGVPRDAAIIDVGGGASSLAATLAERGYSSIVVTDISRGALDKARSEARNRGESIEWIQADIRDADFDREFDLWHDRAVLHFMVRPEDRAAYVSTLRRTVRVGGHMIVATFGPGGPTQCSGLPVNRYGPDDLEGQLEGFELRSDLIHVHTTPSGNPQQFLYAHLQRVS